MNITIMIPTKNRPNFILRQVKYYSLSNFQGVILIGDSSDSRFFEENKSNIIEFGKELTIRHFHKPELTTDKTLSFLSSKVQTDYSAYVADDDIILVESILAGINFLDSHMGYSAVHGKAFLMSLENSECKPFGKVASFIRYPMSIILEDTALGRIKEFFANVLNVNMAIVRSKINLDAFNEVEKLSDYYSKYILGELVHASIVCSRGKIGQIDNCYLIRQGHEVQSFHTINYRELLLRGEWCDQYNILKLAINREILAYDKIEDISGKIPLILSSWLEIVISRALIENKKTPSVIRYIGVKKFLKRFSVVRVLHRFLFPKNILNIVNEEDIVSQNDIRRYLDLVHSNERIKI